MATVIPDITVSYFQNLCTFPTIVTRHIAALRDDDGITQDLVMQATRNVHLVGTYGVDIQANGAGGVRMLAGTTDAPFVAFSRGGCGEAVMHVPQGRLYINDLKITQCATRMVIGTDKPDGLSFEDKVTFEEGVRSLGGIAGRVLSVWKEWGGNGGESGFAFRVSGTDQLELVKYTRVASNQPIMTRRVAVFGSSNPVTESQITNLML